MPSSLMCRYDQESLFSPVIFQIRVSSGTGVHFVWHRYNTFKQLAAYLNHRFPILPTLQGGWIFSCCFSFIPNAGFAGARRPFVAKGRQFSWLSASSATLSNMLLGSGSHSRCRSRGARGWAGLGRPPAARAACKAPQDVILREFLGIEESPELEEAPACSRQQCEAPWAKARALTKLRDSDLEPCRARGRSCSSLESGLAADATLSGFQAQNLPAHVCSGQVFFSLRRAAPLLCRLSTRVGARRVVSFAIFGQNLSCRD